MPSFKVLHLEGANLQDADLDGAHLQGADLTKTNLKGAKVDDADLDGATVVNLNDLKDVLGTFKGKVRVSGQ